MKKRFLYHYCCGHSAREIDLTGVLRPGIPWSVYDRRMIEGGEPASGLLGAPAVLWLTDMATPDREALGLTSHSIPCDRTEFRYAVDSADAAPWSAFVAIWKPRKAWLSLIQDGRHPEHWWISTRPLRVTERVDRRNILVVSA